MGTIDGVRECEMGTIDRLSVSGKSMGFDAKSRQY
jgi:hypothetical protein